MPSEATHYHHEPVMEGVLLIQEQCKAHSWAWDSACSLPGDQIRWQIQVAALGEQLAQLL